MLLGQTILDVKNFSKLHAFLFKENNEQYEVVNPLVHKTPILYDSNGNKITVDAKTNEVSGSSIGDGLSPQFLALATSLNWLSQRTAFYVLAADYLYADLSIQPLRQSFLENIIKRTYPKYNLGVFGNFFSALNRKGEDTVKDILSTSNNFSFSYDIPLFAAYFAKKTQNSKLIVEAAYEEREKKEFKDARIKLRELNLLLENENRHKFLRELNLLKSDIDKNFEKIEHKYGLGEKQGIGLSQLKFLFSYVPLLKDIKIPEELDLRIKSLEFMKHILPRKGFNAVYRNVVEDLLGFDNIGKYKDILLSNVNFDRDATDYDIKTEDPKYIKASSYWKKPM